MPAAVIHTVYGFVIPIKKVSDKLNGTSIETEIVQSKSPKSCLKTWSDVEEEKLSKISDLKYKLVGSSINEIFSVDTINKNIKFFDISHDVADQVGVDENSSIIIGIALYNVPLEYESRKPFCSRYCFTPLNKMKKSMEIVDEHIPKISSFFDVQEVTKPGLYSSQDGCTCCS